MKTTKQSASTFHFFNQLVIHLQESGREGSAQRYRSTILSFKAFRQDVDLSLSLFDASLIGSYDDWLRRRGLSRNTRAFYLSTLRAAYNIAVRRGVVTLSEGQSARQLFAHVFTGMDQTVKRAISHSELQALHALHLRQYSPQDIARQLFLLSFCLRGMSFVDLAYLQKSDLRNGFLSYCRHKTGQRLVIRWEPEMQAILDALPPSNTRFLLPIIKEEGDNERAQYKNSLLAVNRRLKALARKAGISFPLTTLSARHSWATIAHDSDVPLSVISQAMGHGSESTTRIYIASIESSRVDEANKMLLDALWDH